MVEEQEQCQPIACIVTMATTILLTGFLLSQCWWGFLELKLAHLKCPRVYYHLFCCFYSPRHPSMLSALVLSPVAMATPDVLLHLCLAVKRVEEGTMRKMEEFGGRGTGHMAESRSSTSLFSSLCLCPQRLHRVFFGGGAPPQAGAMLVQRQIAQ